MEPHDIAEHLLQFRAVRFDWHVFHFEINIRNNEKIVMIIQKQLFPIKYQHEWIDSNEKGFIGSCGSMTIPSSVCEYLMKSISRYILAGTSVKQTTPFYGKRVLNNDRFREHLLPIIWFWLTWLTDTDWLAGWLADWLTNWLTKQLSYRHIMSNRWTITCHSW